MSSDESVGSEKQQWKKNDQILCKWEGNISYEGKILSVTQRDGKTIYKVKYPGWHDKYNENISEEDAAIRFKPFSAEQLKIEKEKMKEATAKQKTSKRKSSVSEEKPSAKKPKLSKSAAKATDVNTPVSSAKPSSKRKTTVTKPADENTPVSTFKPGQSKTRTNRRLPGSQIKLDSDTPVRKKPVQKPKKIVVDEASKETDEENTENEKKAEVEKPNREISNVLAQKFFGTEEFLVSTKLTDKLKNILEDDLRFIKEEHLLPKLPAMNSVKEITQKYIDLLEDTEDEEVENKKTGIQLLVELFDSHVAKIVAYDHEKPMFDDLLSGKSGYGGLVKQQQTTSEDPKNLSTQLGIAYLLRFINSFEKMPLAIGAKAAGLRNISIADLVSYLDKYSEEFYQGKDGYYPASLEYMSALI